MEPRPDYLSYSAIDMIRIHRFASQELDRRISLQKRLYLSFSKRLIVSLCLQDPLSEDPDLCMHWGKA